MNKIILNLLLRKPFFGYILSTIKTVQSAEIEQIKMVIGPVIQLVYNPEWLESLSEDHAFGAVLHELLHLILLHPFRRGGRNRQVWAMAGDMAANEHIIPEMLPAESLSVEKASRLLAFKFEPGRSAEYYYDALLEAAPPESLPLSYTDEKMMLRFPDEQEIAIKIDEETDLSEINQRAVECSLEEITRQAAQEGEIPGSLQGIMKGLYTSVDVNWRSILKQFISGKGRMQIHKTVKRVSRRFDDLPGTKRRKNIEALVAIDESSSINDEDVMKFYKELMILKRAVKSDIQVIRFDTDCTRPVPLEKYLRVKDRVKKGGTDFRPVFGLADSMAARLVLVFTDGDGIMPESVKQKVLWILTRKPEKAPPFGDSVQFKG